MSNPNTSATGGYLEPVVVVPPEEDNELDDILHDAVVGICGLSGDRVRPRWQLQPPPQPPADFDWVAVGVTLSDPLGTWEVIHNSSGDGSDEFYRNERVSVTASFYGPNAGLYVAKLRDGIVIEQNRWPLSQKGIAFYDVASIVSVPQLDNMQWVRQLDLTIRFLREVKRTYPVLNLLEASGTIHTDSGEVKPEVDFDTDNVASP
jgi:hypothetical protein